MITTTHSAYVAFWPEAVARPLTHRPPVHWARNAVGCAVPGAQKLGASLRRQLRALGRGGVLKHVVVSVYEPFDRDLVNLTLRFLCNGNKATSFRPLGSIAVECSNVEPEVIDVLAEMPEVAWMDVLSPVALMAGRSAAA